MVATAAATFAAPYRGDLEFRGALDEIEALIQDQGPNGVATYRAGFGRIGTTRYDVDSLEVTGDTVRFPSLRKAGFVRDHIDLFNDYTARRSVRRALLGDDSVTRLSGTASLFRLVRSASGDRVVGPSLNRFALTVISPFSELRSTPVRTADWHSGPGLVGLFGTALFPVGDSTITSPQRIGPQGCRIVARGAERLLYCALAPGANVGKGYDLGFTLARPASWSGGASLMADRLDQVRLNGAPLDTRAKVDKLRLGAGDLLYRSSVGPIVLTDIEDGVLAGYQWVNGREAYRTLQSGTIQFFARAGRGITGIDGRPITVSLDAALSRDLDARIDRFVGQRSRLVELVSVVVADLGTGELLAIAQSRPRAGQPLVAYEPILLGSMVKPITAAALLARQPDLARLTVDWAGPQVEQLGGIQLTHPFGNPANGCRGTITFELFLQCSSNQFAAELVVRSLQRTAGTRAIVSRGRVPNDLLERSALADGLLDLFDDIGVRFGVDRARSPRVWNSQPGAAQPGLTMWPFKSEPWFIYPHPDSTGTPIDWLVRWAFGAWENRWTMLGAAEAFARIATDHAIHLSLRRQGPSQFSAVSDAARRAFGVVRAGLDRVADIGTAAGLKQAMRATVGEGDTLAVLAKTGTLDDPVSAAGGRELGVKALAVVVGHRASGQPATVRQASLSCGTVAIIYVDFRDDWRRQRGAATGDRLPDLHRRFAEEELAPVYRDHWRRLRVCTQ
jgi:hypothetical protein